MFSALRRAAAPRPGQGTVESRQAVTHKTTGFSQAGDAPSRALSGTEPTADRTTESGRFVC